MNPTETHQPEKNRERNCIFYAMNESLFGQSYSQLQNMEQEMGIKLNIDFSHCYLILTGLPRRFYMERLGMRRSDLIDPVGEDGDVADRRSLMDPKPDVIGLQKGPQMLRQRLNIHLPPGGDHQQDTLGVVVVQHGHLA